MSISIDALRARRKQLQTKLSLGDATHAATSTFATPANVKKQDQARGPIHQVDDESPTAKRQRTLRQTETVQSSQSQPTESCQLDSASAYAAAYMASDHSMPNTSTSSPSPDVHALLSYRSVRESESSKSRSTPAGLLSKPTAKESLALRNHMDVDEEDEEDEEDEVEGSGAATEIGSKPKRRGTSLNHCQYRTKRSCDETRWREHGVFAHGLPPCSGIHFVVVFIPGVTNPALGECSWLNNCKKRFCAKIHYEIYPDDLEKMAEYERRKRERRERKEKRQAESMQMAVGAAAAAANTVAGESVMAALQPQATSSSSTPSLLLPSSTLSPPSRPAEWLNCDVRSLDMSVLGKFNVIMMDPPWQINMSLPYETMDDQTMLNLDIASLQTDGICLVWVVTRALELGRRCLARWGYRYAGDIIWLKIDQLFRLRRMGRTGHWLNHTKEHCLIGFKGKLPTHRNIDCDVIVSQTRETSRKSEEIYGMIERLYPGARKLEIFGRQHNTRPGWLTLGNQLDGLQVHDEKLKQRIESRYGVNALKGRWLGPGPDQPNS